MLRATIFAQVVRPEEEAMSAGNNMQNQQGAKKASQMPNRPIAHFSVVWTALRLTSEQEGTGC